MFRRSVGIGRMTSDGLCTAFLPGDDLKLLCKVNPTVTRYCSATCDGVEHVAAWVGILLKDVLEDVLEDILT